LKGEVAGVLIYTMNLVHKYKLSDKIVAFYGDSCNTNFGGAARRGKNIVFAKLKTSNLKVNIQGYRMCHPYFADFRQVLTFYQLMLRP
jgi:hypothetical protein